MFGYPRRQQPLDPWSSLFPDAYGGYSDGAGHCSDPYARRARGAGYPSGAMPEMFGDLLGNQYQQQRRRRAPEPEPVEDDLDVFVGYDMYGRPVTRRQLK